MTRSNRRAKLRLVKRRNHVLPVMGAHLHLDHALPYTTLLWVANCSVLNFVLVSINSPYHGGGVVVRPRLPSATEHCCGIALENGWQQSVPPASPAPNVTPCCPAIPPCRANSPIVTSLGPPTLCYRAYGLSTFNLFTSTPGTISSPAMDASALPCCSVVGPGLCRRP